MIVQLFIIMFQYRVRALVGYAMQCGTQNCKHTREDVYYIYVHQLHVVASSPHDQVTLYSYLQSSEQLDIGLTANLFIYLFIHMELNP